jgi:hypothetical protein
MESGNLTVAVLVLKAVKEVAGMKHDKVAPIVDANVRNVTFASGFFPTQ